MYKHYLIRLSRSIFSSSLICTSIRCNLLNFCFHSQSKIFIYLVLFILLILQAPNLLSPEEENRVNEVLKGFAETVRKRRLMAYPYFKDFDRVCILPFDLSGNYVAGVERGRGGGMKFGQIL